MPEASIAYCETVSLPLLTTYAYCGRFVQTTLTVAGTAHYHDIGRFLADLENQFPHVRLLNLTLDVNAASAEPETLSFRMDIVTLARPNAS